MERRDGGFEFVDWIVFMCIIIIVIVFWGGGRRRSDFMGKGECKEDEKEKWFRKCYYWRL